MVLKKHARPSDASINQTLTKYQAKIDELMAELKRKDETIIELQAEISYLKSAMRSGY
jgi:uncharacterized coiled-coil DUF342 family protein